MHGEQTTAESIRRLQDAMTKHISDQFEIQLYKKNSTCRVAVFYYTLSALINDRIYELMYWLKYDSIY